LEAKQYAFLAATVIVIPVVAWLGCRYRWAERGIVAGAFFSTCYLVDINLLSMEWYRGDTRGFEFGLTDWMVISLIIVMARSPRWSCQSLSLLPPNSGPIVLYLAVAFLSAIAAYVPVYAGFGLMKLLRAMAVYWVAYNYLRQEEDLRFILYILAAIVCMEFFLVLKQRAFGVYRAVGSTPHPNTLAMYINMMNMVFLSFFLNEKPGVRRRWLYLACVGMGTLIVAATFSRGALAMMVGCYGLVVLFSIVRRPSRQKFLLVGLMALAAMPVAVKLAPAIIDRFENAPVESGESRGQANDAAYAMANQHLLGVGINNYSHVINETAYSRYIPNEMDRGIVHNIYLLHACEMGWPGLVAFVILICNFLWIGLRTVASRQDDPASWMAIGILVGMLGFWLQSFLEWAFRQTYLTVEFFMLAGFLAALPRVVKATHANRKRQIAALWLLKRSAAHSG
jgi:O-antigen ligase